MLGAIDTPTTIPRRQPGRFFPFDPRACAPAVSPFRFETSDGRRRVRHHPAKQDRANGTEHERASERASEHAATAFEPKRGEARRGATRRDATRRDATREMYHGRESERAGDRRKEGREGTRIGRGEGKRAFIIAVRFCHTPGARARNSALPGIANTNFGTRQRRPKFTNEISELAGKMWNRAARSISRKISGGQQERD